MVKQLDTQVNQILRQTKVQNLNSEGRKTLANMRQSLVDAQKYTRAYELSEDRNEQIANQKAVKKWLSRVRKDILEVSQQDVFDAIDVAHLSAQIEQIIVSLK